MKRCYLFSVLVGSLLPLFLYAQDPDPEFWGMTSLGANDFGTIFKTDGQGEKLRTVHVFSKNPGRSPRFRLYQAANGKMYGVTGNGGIYSNGVLYEYLPGADTTRKLADFSDIGKDRLGAPATEPVEAGNGKLYGTTISGGEYDGGTLYVYDPALDSTYKIFDFNRPVTGRAGQRGLIRASNGKLYNVLASGGPYDMGGIYELDPNGDVYTKLFDLKDTIDGFRPQAIMQASNGKFYGVTQLGGLHDKGVLFEYDLSTNTYTKKADFDGDNGRIPITNLTEMNGKLYGVTGFGGMYDTGVLFEYDPLADTLVKKREFWLSSNSVGPSELVAATDGKLYGVTALGGIESGTLYSYDPVSGIFAIEHDFLHSGDEGNRPMGLMQAADGLLYGVCSGGGDLESFGVMFTYDINTKTYSRVFDFWDYSDGGEPRGGLTRSSLTGKLYGLAFRGVDGGVLFEVDPVTETYEVKYDFTAPGDGGALVGTLEEASNGKLYGMSVGRGAAGDGTLFEYDPTTEVYTKKHDFTESTGGTPRGSLTLASNGKLYGLTDSGGGFHRGVIFEYDPLTAVYRVVYHFPDDLHGHGEYGDLVEGLPGKLYGAIAGGANNNGVLMEYDIATEAYTVKAEFESLTTGDYTYGRMVKAHNGRLYGVAAAGGKDYQGVLYEYDPQTAVLRGRVEFDLEDHGGGARGELLVASNGKLYGLVLGGGKYGKGTMFEYDPLTNAFEKKYDFTGKGDGMEPYGGLVELYSPFEGIEENKAALFRLYPNPAGEQLQISWQERVSEGVLALTTIHGQLLLQQQLTQEPLQRISLAGLSPGVYLLKVETASGSQTVKVVKR